MIFFRICREKYSKGLDGTGAEKVGGRWNSMGVPVLYVSDSIAACVVEIAVHHPLGMIPNGYVLVTIQVPNETEIVEVKKSKLAQNWSNPQPTEYTQKIGDNFIKENKHLLLKVPSASVQGEFNYLINPKHKDFSKVKIKKIEPFGFDKRLFIKS